MALGLVTVFGGTGFLGHRAVQRLASDGWTVRVASRNPGRPGGLPADARVELESTDIRKDDQVARALRGASGVVNAVSLYVERGDLTFQAIHVDGADRVASRAREAGVGGLVHISGIGSDPEAESPYAAARG
ncbi:MAG TPA: NAD(P)H-binding protein, partial [Gammaproteobacteria bacterium]|nr:NAD(P)H-binding protein [Gammaproteobacteria bacterium]